jgi:hypothetical protein
MIYVEIVGAEQVRAKFEALPAGVKERLSATVRRLAIDLQRHVVADKLSGQVLKNRTGTLRRSINQHVEESGTSVTGIVGADMNEARYARAHEYGFHGTVEVRAHMRTVTQAFGRRLKNPRQAMVQAYSMRMNLAERSYLRSSLRDMRQTIIDNFRESLDEAMR